MTFELNVQADFKQVERMLFAAQKDILPKATTRSLNVTAKAVQSLAVKLIAKDLGIKQKDVRKGLKIYKATWKNLYSSIRARGERIPLIAFVSKSKRRPGAFSKQKGVRYKRGANSVVRKGAFIATMPTGHTGVFVRKDESTESTGKDSKGRPKKNRLPLHELRGASIPHVFIQDAINRAMLKLAQERWNKEFPHQVRHYLRRAGYSGNF